MDNQSIQIAWNCTYHIVFIRIPEKVMYGSNKRDLVEIHQKFVR